MTAQPAIIDEAPGVVASVDRVDAWLAVARTGDRFVYATRASLPVRSTGAQRLRVLQARGFVHLMQARAPLAPKLFNYIAERSSLPLPGAKPAGRAKLCAVETPLVDGEAAAVDALLPVLERAARFGLPCPTDCQLAEKAALPREAIAPTLAAMRAANVIRIATAPRPTLRRVTIVASGLTTGMARA